MAAAVATRQLNVRSILGRAESMLLGTTSIAKDSPFVFGVAKARQTAPQKKASPTSVLVKGLEFTLAEARDRIKEFMRGDFAPKALSELRDYMSARMLKLETRRSRDGVLANYVVDAQTKQSLLASSVDRRLSRPGIARMFGTSLEAEAEVVRRRAVRSPEQVIAHVLRNQNAGILLSGDAKRSPFRDWNDMAFSAPALFDGREIAMQGDELWTGNVLAIASEDPSENLSMLRQAHAELMAKAKKEGREASTKLSDYFIFPAATRADAAAGRFTPGMPILLKDGACRTHLIDPRLSSANLTDEFGSGLRDRYAAMKDSFSAKVKDLASRQKGADVLDMETFRQQFARQKPRQAQPMAPTPVRAIEPQQPTRRAANDHIVRHEIGEDGRERMILIDRRSGSETPFHPDAIAAGRYPKEDGFGLPAGYVVVDATGGYSHLDSEERFHNSMGPAVVPAPGSNEQPGYAQHGVFREVAPYDARMEEETRNGRSPVYGR